ncbi:MAG: DUF960 domain-containing protein [Streptococcaceae bacterium]|jgi:hypothetical protein|nr:DUF960 domain-containing protein [Streptococcaceae bacterium]
MAFTHTRRRYASLGTVAVLPGSIIDLFWYIIDTHLKDTIELREVLNFEMLDNHGKLAVKFSQSGNRLDDQFEMVIDTGFPFEESWPRLFHAYDDLGRETIMTTNELDA